jgi:hypothetical protein
MPNNEVIETLATLLKQAQSGELEGFAAALLFDDSRVGMSIEGEAWRAPATTIGLLWQVQQTIHSGYRSHAQTTPP